MHSIQSGEMYSRLPSPPLTAPADVPVLWRPIGMAPAHPARAPNAQQHRNPLSLPPKPWWEQPGPGLGGGTFPMMVQCCCGGCRAQSPHAQHLFHLQGAIRRAFSAAAGDIQRPDWNDLFTPGCMATPLSRLHSVPVPPPPAPIQHFPHDNSVHAGSS